jgi:PPOX class probable F420-dependent enzyme
MKQRDRVPMTPDEVIAFLAAHRKMHLATISADGSLHLVTMYYVLLDGRITFWTYRSSQKALNMARDPRVSCLVEAGEQYFDLRGVQVQGRVRAIDDPAAVRDIGRRIVAAMAGHEEGSRGSLAGDTPPSHPAAGGADPLSVYVSHAARKRLGYAVQPGRIISWDHRKLAAAAG